VVGGQRRRPDTVGGRPSKLDIDVRELGIEDGLMAEKRTRASGPTPSLVSCSKYRAAAVPSGMAMGSLA
jgi:hypothetical protein